MAVVLRAFKYAYDAVATFEPWREKLGDDDFDQVVAILTDRDRQLEDYLHDHDAALDALLSQIIDRTQAANITTAQTLGVSAYTDLATVGPAVTVNIGPAGQALVTMSTGAELIVGNEVALAQVSFAISGATTIAAPPSIGGMAQEILAFLSFNTATHSIVSNNTYTGVFLITGLNAGSTTFTMKYKNNGSAGNIITFANRLISVQPF